MTLAEIVSYARDKSRFSDLPSYLDFCCRSLDFAVDGLQAVIVSQNENHYQFYQYRQDGHFNISRPLNSRLMYGADGAAVLMDTFPALLRAVRDIPESDTASRAVLTRSVYTIQQAIGAALDALPAGQSNFARKINGDLFERLIQLLLRTMGVECATGTVKVPVYVLCMWAMTFSFT